MTDHRLPGNPRQLDHYDKSGASITFDEWLHLFSNPLYATVRVTQATNAAASSETFTVVTMWIGTNTSVVATEPPMIFETTVIDSVTQLTREPLRAYPTLTEAHDGHQEIVDELTKPWGDARVIEVWPDA